MTQLRILQDLLLDAQEQRHFTGIERKLEYRLTPGKAFVCIGPRRAGKSTLLHQIMAKLMSQGVPSQRFLYVNFFDDRLETVRRGDFHGLLEAFYGLHPELKKSGGVHAFLDEVQMAPGWEGLVDRLLRAEGMRVYVTGSSARLLAREVGTALRGRSLSWELFPFSFLEFLNARGVEASLRGQAARLRVRKAFGEFWRTGGFPEVLDADERLRARIHQEYFNTMIFRDVVDRHDALHPRAARDMAHRLLNSAACLYSINALTGYLQSLGHKVTKSFVGDLVDWLEDAYALFTVRLFDPSPSRQHVNPKKIYAVDHALVRSTASTLLPNHGHLLENLVFTDARRRGFELHYYRTRGGREVDFAWRNSEGRLFLVQVCETMPDGSPARTREVSALAEALREQPEAQARFVTRDDAEESISLPEGSVACLPVWQHLLDDSWGA